MLVEYWSHRVW